jgi:lipopolysaccharide export LptBFGC system permease protein LptF
MARLSRYLLRLFSVEAMALFAVAAFLLFLIQCLRLFDLVSTRGQSVLTLLGQAALGMPSLGIVFLYVCLAIGLGRALRGLQDRSELQIIHVSALVPALVRSVVVYALGGTVAVLFLAHIVDPASVRTTDDWSESIAADLVSRSMIPHRFTEIVGGVSMIIGSRDSQGQITNFFADDRRNPQSRRTYFAKSALITRDDHFVVEEERRVPRLEELAVQGLEEHLGRGALSGEDPLQLEGIAQEFGHLGSQRLAPADVEQREPLAVHHHDATDSAGLAGPLHLKDE